MPENAATLPAESFAEAAAEACKPRAKVARSRISNHRDLLPNLDGRSSAARRFRDLVVAFVTDQGGIDQCSEIKIGLLRRLASATVQSELLEARMVDGEPIDVPTLCQLASTCVRLSQRLGIERVPKDVSGPSLGDMLKADLRTQRRRRQRLETAQRSI